MHELITFLGKGDYVNIIYSYENKNTNPTSYLWHELTTNDTFKDWFVDKVYILGTRQSAWEELLDLTNLSRSKKRDLSKGLEDILDSTESIQSIETHATWKQFKEVFANNHWQPVLIETGQNQNEQINILKTVHDLDLPENSHVSIDVTHGLRHLPMLGIVIAMYLQQLKNIQIDRIFYGAYDLQEINNSDTAPIIDLKGLLHITDWIGALQTFDKDGDYGVFDNLLKNDGFDTNKELKAASFSERITHLSTDNSAVLRVRNILGKLEDHSTGGLSALFKKQLQNRLKWAEEGKDDTDERVALYKQQRALAYSYIEKKNYVQAVILTYEALKTYYCTDNNDCNDFHSYTERNKVRIPTGTHYGQRLDFLRKRFAHASTAEASPQLLQLFKSEEKLNKAIKEIIDNLLID